MKLRHNDFRFELKAVGSGVAGESDAGTIEGYASVFGGSPDAYGDVIAPGAFAESLAKHRREGTFPIMLWGHNSSEPPIGNWTDMAEDGKGLWVKGDIDLDDPLGTRVYRALKRRSMKGLSIGYETKDSESDPKRPGVRLLKTVDLWEVSPVPFPAQVRASVETVKSYLKEGSLPTLRQFEESLRELGFSNSQAVTIASKGLAALLRRESGDDDAERAAFLAALKG
jgi:HK97 family phage prohead protease